MLVKLMNKDDSRLVSMNILTSLHPKVNRVLWLIIHSLRDRHRECIDTSGPRTCGALYKSSRLLTG